MGYDEKTAERVRRILSARRDVVEKKMVGEMFFIVKSSMCCGVTNTALMVRVDPEAREWALIVCAADGIRWPAIGWLCVSLVVLPERRGPVSTTAGNDLAASRRVLSIARWIKRL